MEADEARIYSEVIREVAENKPEIAYPLCTSPKIILYGMPPHIMGAVPDYERAPWLKEWLGYEKPPMLLNPVYARILTPQELMPVLYHEAVHEAQMDKHSIEKIVNKYVDFEDREHMETFYQLRKILMKLPRIGYMLKEGEAQYLTRKAFPNMSELLAPYKPEERLYKHLIEASKPERYLETLAEFMMLEAHLEQPYISRAS